MALSAEVRAAENERPSRDGHPEGMGSDAQSKPSPGALLKRLKRGDLRGQEEKDGNGGSMTAAIARDGVWSTLLGIRKADQRKGVEGSRLIHPNSPFFTGAPFPFTTCFGDCMRPKLGWSPRLNAQSDLDLQIRWERL